MTDLATIQASWDQAACQDAMWNIITDPRYVNGGWDPQEFYNHGQREINAAMRHLVALGLPERGPRALDFGCGIGRLTMALAFYFDRVDGVDISSEMINRAREGVGRQCHYHHNTGPNLALFPARTFDFVYSMIVLQHMPQDLQEGYVREFFRVLTPGGIAMFEMPDGPDEGHPGWPLSMYGVARDTAEQWIADGGGSLVDVEDLGEHGQWRCYRYTATAKEPQCAS